MIFGGIQDAGNAGAEHGIKVEDTSRLFPDLNPGSILGFVCCHPIPS